MGFQLTKFDAGLADNVFLALDGINPTSGFPPGSGASGSRIVFQFPPLITSEDKKINWSVKWKDFAWEPFYIWEGATARKITLTAMYVVGGPSSGVVKWTASRVATEIRRYKTYFYHGGIEDPTNAPLFQLSMYEHAPGSEGGGTKPIPTTWRGTNVSFKYSDAIIVDEADKFPIGGFPLKTDVTLSLEMASNIGYKDGKSVYAFANTLPKPFQSWY